MKARSKRTAEPADVDSGFAVLLLPPQAAALAAAIPVRTKPTRRLLTLTLLARGQRTETPRKSNRQGERQFWKRCSQAAELRGPTETATAGINSPRATHTIGTLRRLSPPPPARRIAAIRATAAAQSAIASFTASWCSIAWQTP